ncbi:PTS sugar transporter subunit IIC [Escherichia coli]
MLQLRLTPLWLHHSTISGYRRSSEHWGRYRIGNPSRRRGPGTDHHRSTITVAFQHAADKAADNGNLTAISWIAVFFSVPASNACGYSGCHRCAVRRYQRVQNMLNAIPEVVTNGSNIAGGMIAVVGYAMVINMTRAGDLMPFFYLGFLTAAFTNFNLVALGVIGTVMAVLYIQLSRNTTA